MAQFNSPLDYVRVASPCSADWDQMTGNDRMRFCGQCNLNVYNLSSMTKAEAESFVANGEGRLCIRYYQRRDGSILTRDCPVGLRALRRRMASVAKAIGSAVLGFLAGLGAYEGVTSASSLDPRRPMGQMVVKDSPEPAADVTVCNTIKDSPIPVGMGKVAFSPRWRTNHHGRNSRTRN